MNALASSYEHAVRLRYDEPQFTYIKRSILRHFLYAFSHTVFVQDFNNYSTRSFTDKWP
jgi:hypothetical protein